MSTRDRPVVRLTIDGREVETRAGELLIKAAEDSGTFIPRFCWHPRMNPVGMCRMCLVEIETPRGRLIVPSCVQPVNDGMVAHTESEAARKAQEGVLEFLLLNHPLDCPVCDKGGECPLQDQTMSYGPGESRFVEEKRHFAKPVPISDLVLLDRERCILCARCTRFSDEISGDPLIEFQNRGNYTQVLTFPDEPFNSYFSGNTVQICPVGALTAVPYRFRARPWDLRIAESTGVIHTEGSRLSVHASQNRVLRLLGVDNGATNQGWLSDKERFGFEFIGSPDRLRTPLIREGSDLREAGWGEALDMVADRLRDVITREGGAAVAALGGARGTNEDAYALSKFMRVTVGSNNLDAQLGDGPGGEVPGRAGRAGADRRPRVGPHRPAVGTRSEGDPPHPLPEGSEGGPGVGRHPRRRASEGHRSGRPGHPQDHLPARDRTRGTGASRGRRGWDEGRPGSAGRGSAGGPRGPSRPGRGPTPGRVGGRLRPPAGGDPPPVGPSGEHLRCAGHGGGAGPAAGPSAHRRRRSSSGTRFGVGATAHRAGSRRAGDSGRRGRRGHRLPHPVRFRPGPRPGGFRRRGGPVRRRVRGGYGPVPHRLVPPRRRGAPRPGLRREEGHRDQPRRPGTEGQPPGAGAWSGPGRLVDPRRSGHPDGPPDRADLREGHRGRDRPVGARLRRDLLGLPRMGSQGGRRGPHRRRRPAAAVRAPDPGFFAARSACTRCTWPVPCTTTAFC